MTDSTDQNSGLAPALAAIGGISPLIGTGFHPQFLIHAVNLLLGLGVESASRALHAYAATPGGDVDRAILAMRVLFVPRDANAPIPPPALGKPDTALAQDPKLCPAWPVLLHRDIPFLPIGFFQRGGASLGAAHYLDRCLEMGRLRDRPLAPESSPLEAAEELVRSPAWQFLVPAEQQGRARGMIRMQALNTLRHVRDFGEDVRAELLAADPSRSEQAWRALADDRLLRVAHWSNARARFG